MVILADSSAVGVKLVHMNSWKTLQHFVHFAVPLSRAANTQTGSAFFMFAIVCLKVSIFPWLI
jgi:hypothetical protein